MTALCQYESALLWQVDFLINRLNALEELMKSAEEQLALELDHRLAPLISLILVHGVEPYRAAHI
jgi:hypothetical protein